MATGRIPLVPEIPHGESPVISRAAASAKIERGTGRSDLGWASGRTTLVGVRPIVGPSHLCAPARQALGVTPMILEAGGERVVVRQSSERRDVTALGNAIIIIVGSVAELSVEGPEEVTEDQVLEWLMEP